MNLKKLSAVAMSIVMALSLGCMSAFATEYNSGEDGTASGTVNVTASVASSYTITVPQSVNMTSSGTGSGTYTANIEVKISGDIGASQTVTVTPSAPELTLANSSTTKTSTFSDGIDNTWNRTEVAAAQIHNFTLTADLTPGTWTGVANFNCSLS